jgi:uncharacterized membrane protein (UPF0127 family)
MATLRVRTARPARSATRASALISLFSVLFLSLSLSLSLPAAAQSVPQPRLRTETLQVRFFQIVAEIAETPQQRMLGLMGRRSLGAGQGMLFVFDAPEVQCFWMKNTPLPLTIAFIGPQGRVVNMADMEPLSEQSHCSREPVRFALEMERGWFRQRGILEGDAVTGGPIR